MSILVRFEKLSLSYNIRAMPENEVNAPQHIHTHDAQQLARVPEPLGIDNFGHVGA